MKKERRNMEEIDRFIGETLGISQAESSSEQTVAEFWEKGRAVSIVTSDQAVQVQAFSGKGVSRYSSREFYGILEEMRRQISEMEL